MYNVLEELRAGEPLSVASQLIYERGLISVLRLHDDLDRVGEGSANQRIPHSVEERLHCCRSS